MFTDETKVFLDAIFAAFPLISQRADLLISSFIVSIFTLLLIVHRHFVKRVIYGLTLASLQTIVQLMLIVAIAHAIVPFRFGMIPIEKEVFYVFSMFAASALMSVVIIWQEYTHALRYLNYLETIMARHSKKKEDKESRFVRFEGFLWKDFEDRLVAYREEVDEILKSLKDERFCFLSGPQASGKSVILRSVGYQLILRGYIVFAIEDVERFDIEKTLSNLRNWNLPNVVLMIDDVHRNPKICADFLGRVNNLNIRVLISSRPLNPLAFREGEGAKLLDIYQRRIEVKVSPNLIARMIRKYCYSQGVKIKIDKEDVNSVIDKCGIDLWLVTYLLSSWDPKKGSLKKVAIENIYQKIYETRIVLWNMLGRETSTVMQLVSALYQYEIPVVERYLDKRDLTSVALKLAGEGCLIKRGRHYYLHHPSVARIYLQAFSYYGFIGNLLEYSSKVLISYLEECRDDRARVLYKLTTLPFRLYEEQKEIIENLVARIDFNGLISQVDAETDIEKNGHFLKYISQIDIEFAKRVLHGTNADNLKKTFYRELSIRKQRGFISDVSMVEKEYAETIMSFKGPRLVVLCLDNEEPIIPRVLPQVYGVDLFDLVLVIDDGSTDLTAKMARDYGADVLRNKTPEGVIKSLLRGIEVAKDKNADLVCLCPFSFPIRYIDLKRLARPIIYGDADLVVGSGDWPPVVMNKQGMKAFLKYLNKERQDQIFEHGLSSAKILFGKVLRTLEVPVTYTFPREIYQSYLGYRRHRRYPHHQPYEDIVYEGIFQGFE